MIESHSVQCLTEQELAQFLLGRVPAERLDAIAAHLDTCTSCQSTLSDIEQRSDSFVEGFRELPDEDDIARESACENVVDLLVRNRFQQHNPTPNAVPVPATIGPYKVLELLGAGGMGVVYKAWHPKLKRAVAIKLLPLQQWAGTAAIARFEHEMEAIGGLDHPHIVRSTDAGVESGMHYLVMDYVDGIDLARLVRCVGPLPTTEACEIVRQTCLGLAYIHRRDLVHRDIKPSNLMLNKDGVVKILDLGLAISGQQYLGSENHLTTIGQLMGTLDYMAPEQAADSHEVDARADIYSLGATLFTLLAGRPPFGDARHGSLLKKVLALATQPAPSVREIKPEIPEEVDQMLQQCLAKSPPDRYENIEQLQQAIEPLARDADLGSLVQRTARQPGRRAGTKASTPLLSSFEPPHAAARDNNAKRVRHTRARRYTWIAIACLAVLLAGVGAVIARIATDRGELVVQSDDPNARIVISRADGTAVRTMQLEHAKEKTSIRSGHYIVELLGNADQFHLSPDDFTVLRGGVITLRVERKSNATVAGVTNKPHPPRGLAAKEPMYDGKSFEQWFAVVRTERSPKRLIDAINAISVLCPDNRSEDVAKAILHLMRIYGSMSSFESNKIQEQLTGQAIESLMTIAPSGVAEAFFQEALNGNERSRMFLEAFLGRFPDIERNLSNSPYARYSTLRKAMVIPATKAMARLAEMARGNNKALASWAVSFAIDVARVLPLDWNKIDGCIRMFRQALTSANSYNAQGAAFVLSRYKPDTPGVAKVLAPVSLGLSTYFGRSQALQALRKLGVHAKPAVPALASFLLAVHERHLVRAGSGMGTGASGGMSMSALPSGSWSPSEIKLSLEILEQLGPDAKAALPALTKISKTPGELAQYQAKVQRVIAKIQKQPDATTSK